MAYEDHDDFGIYGKDSIENWEYTGDPYDQPINENNVNYSDIDDIDEGFTTKEIIKTIAIVLIIGVFFYFILK